MAVVLTLFVAILSTTEASAKRVVSLAGETLVGKTIQGYQSPPVKLPDGTVYNIVVFAGDNPSGGVIDRAVVRFPPDAEPEVRMSSGDVLTDTSGGTHQVEFINEIRIDGDGNGAYEFFDLNGNQALAFDEAFGTGPIVVVSENQTFDGIGQVASLGGFAFNTSGFFVQTEIDNASGLESNLFSLEQFTGFVPVRLAGTGDEVGTSGFFIQDMNTLSGVDATSEGIFVFEANVGPADNSSSQEAIIRGDTATPGVLGFVLKEGDPPPVIPDGVITRFTSFSLGGEPGMRAVEVLYRYSTPNNSSASDEAVALCGHSACQNILLEGDDVPGMPGVIFRTLGAPLIDTDGTSMRTRFEGAGIDNTNDVGFLHIDHPTGTVDVVAQEGDPFSGSEISEFLDKAWSGDIPLVTIRRNDFSHALAAALPGGPIPVVFPGLELTAPDMSTLLVETVLPIAESNGRDGQANGTAGGGFTVIAGTSGGPALLACDCLEDAQCPAGFVCDQGECVTDAEPAALSIVKSVQLLQDVDADGTPTVGDLLQYVIEVTNTGGETSELLTVEDTPDANTALVVGSVTRSPPTGTVVSGNNAGDTTIRVDFQGIGTSETVTVAYRAEIVGGEVGQLIVNDAVARLESGQQVTAEVQVQVGRTLIVEKRDFLQEDVDGDEVADPGDVIRYEVTISLAGALTLLNPAMVFEDAPDTQTEIVSGSVTTTHGTIVSGNEVGATLIVVSIDDVTAAPQPVTIRFDVRVRESAASSPVSNQGVVKDRGPLGANGLFLAIPSDDPDVAGADDPTDTPIEIQPPATCRLTPESATNELSLLHVVTITVERGSERLAGVPVHFQITEGSVNAGLTHDAVTDATGNAQFAYRSTTVGRDTIRATGTAGADEFACEATKDWVQGAPDVTLGKQLVDPLERVLLGGLVTYRLIVHNLGPGEATGVVVTDRIPDGGALPDGVAVPPGCGFDPAVPNPDGTTSPAIVCNIGVMAEGEARTIDVQFMATKLGELCNTAGVTPDADRDPTNNAPESPVCIPVVAAADLAWNKTVDADFARPDRPLTYTIEVQNVGATDATDVVITDFLPRQNRVDELQVTVLERHTTKGAFRDPAPEGKEIVEVGTLAPDETVAVTIVVQPLESATDGLCNVADVKATQVDENDANDGDDPVCIPIPRTNLAIEKSGPSHAEPGEPVTYTITVRNDGPDDATGVAVTDLLPSNSRLVSAESTKGVPVALLGTVVVPVGSLAALEETVTITVVVEPMLATRNFCNLVAVLGEEFDPDLSNNSSGTCAAVKEERPSDARLAVTKFDLTDPVLSGDGFTYVIRVENLGNEAATNVGVVDSLPPQLAFVSAEVSHGSFDVSGDEVSWHIGTLAGKAEMRIRVRALVSGSIRNVAVATSDQGSVSDAESTTVTETVVPVHDLAITDVRAPRRIKLDPDTLAVADKAPVIVTVQNRSPHGEFIDAESLAELVRLRVMAMNQDGAAADGANCSNPAVTLRGSNPAVPIELAPKQEIDVIFRAAIDCPANGLLDRRQDTSKVDYKVVAHVSHEAIDGEADTHPEDDACPRATFSWLPYVDPNPDGTIEDNTCRKDVFIDVFNPDLVH